GLALVARSHAEARRADLAGPRRLLPGDVLASVVGQDDVRPVAQPQIILDAHPGSPQVADLLEERGGIHDDAVADHAQNLLAQDARRDVMQGEAPFSGADGVAGVRSSAIPRHDIDPLGQEVNDLALPLVPPLRAKHDEAGHALSLRSSPRGWPRRVADW